MRHRTRRFAHGLRPRQAGALGIATAALTAAFYEIGSGRAFGWDASNTVRHFVATPSLLDPFRSQIGFNNHVLFSGLDHIVFTVFGSQDERLLRVLPIVVAAAAVGLLTYEVGRRLGAPAGIVAGAVVATNPIAIQEFREVRGYSLLVLFAVISTQLFVRLRAQQSPSRRLVAAYCLVSGLGVATHLYMVAVLMTQAAIAVRDLRSLRIWLPRLAAAIVLGVAVAAVPLRQGFATPNIRTFQPWFPLTVSYDLLGGEGVAFTFLVPVVLVGLWRLRRNADLHRALATVALVVIGAWLVAPVLHSRYFLWVLPAVGVLAAAAVARRPVLIALVVVAVAAQVVTQLPELGEDQFPNRAAGALVQRAQDQRQRTCVIGSTGITIAAYAANFREVRTAGQLASCDLVVAADGRADQAAVRTAAGLFPYSTTLPAEDPGEAFARSPALLIPRA
ncbi:MAG: glycosyltransferase family 39 protein [Acidimicrobiia bacterium]|nr:glycosyltransferase family 39 protein [Acidimicrobiia bacterium]